MVFQNGLLKNICYSKGYFIFNKILVLHLKFVIIYYLTILDFILPMDYVLYFMYSNIFMKNQIEFQNISKTSFHPGSVNRTVDRAIDRHAQL